MTANPVSSIPRIRRSQPSTYTIGGLVNGDSGSCGLRRARLNTAATPSSATGQYPIAVTLGTLSAANYNFSFAGSQVTIGEATLTIGQQNLLSAIYGAAIPGLTYTIAGFVNSDTATAVSVYRLRPSIPRRHRHRRRGNTPSTVTPGTLSSANYTLQLHGLLGDYRQGNARRRENIVRDLRSGDSALTYALAGFLDGGLSGGLRLAPSPPRQLRHRRRGSTPSRPARARSATFLFSFTGSQVTISKAMLTVTASTISSVMERRSRFLTYTITGLVNGDTATAVTGVAALGTTATQGSAAGQYPHHG